MRRQGKTSSDLGGVPVSQEPRLPGVEAGEVEWLIGRKSGGTAVRGRQSRRRGRYFGGDLWRLRPAIDQTPNACEHGAIGAADAEWALKRGRLRVRSSRRLGSRRDRGLRDRGRRRRRRGGENRIAEPRRLCRVVLCALQA